MTYDHWKTTDTTPEPEPEIDCPVCGARRDAEIPDGCRDFGCPDLEDDRQRYGFETGRTTQ